MTRKPIPCGHGFNVWTDFYFYPFLVSALVPPPLWCQSHFLYHCGIELDHLGIWRTASNHLHTQATVLCLRSYFSLRSEFTSSSGNLWWRKTDQVNLWMSLFGGVFFWGGFTWENKIQTEQRCWWVCFVSIRFLLNDAPVPLTGVEGCEADQQGFCSLKTVIESLTRRMNEIDYVYE